MPSSQEILDDIFGPKLKVVTEGKVIDHIPALFDNPARKQLLERILNNPQIKSDEVFERERRTARLSFAFTERERSLFISKFIETREELAEKGILKQNDLPNLMTLEQFKECWFFARNFHPSIEALAAVKEIFSHDKYSSQAAAAAVSSPSLHKTQSPLGPTSDYIIDVVDFTRACALDTEELDSVPFAVSFLKEERRRFDGMVELLYYIPFLVLFSFILVSLRQLPSGYQLHKAIEDNMFDRRFLEPCTGNDCSERAQRVLKFRGSSVTESAYFYEWLRAQVIPTLWAGAATDRGDKLVNQRLIAIGALRLQQVRIDPSDSNRQYNQLFQDSSPDATDLVKINKYYSRSNPAFNHFDRSPTSTTIGGGWSEMPFNQAAIANATAPIYVQRGFRFQHVDESGTLISGYLNSYERSGFIVDLPLNLTKSDAIAAVDQLEKLKWIDSATRMVAARAIFFNKDEQIFGSFFAGFEIPPGGHWMSLLRVNIFRFFTLAQQQGVWIFFFIMLLAWIAWNILTWLVEFTDSVRSSAKALGRPFSSALDAGFKGFPVFVSVVIFTSVKKAFIKDPWTIIESANYCSLIIVWLWRLQIWTEYAGFDTWNNDHFPDNIERYASVNASIDYLESVTIILCYFRLLKTLRIFPILRLIFKSLSQASTDLFGMAFTAGVLIIAFALAGFVSYGALIPDFSTVPYSIVTILRFIVGSYDYAGWESSRSIMSPLFLTLLEILLVIIVLEFITAIIADTFGDISKKQYKADYIKHVIVADLRNVLTSGVIDSPARNPIIMELSGFGRSFVAYLGSWRSLFLNYCCGTNEADMTAEERKIYLRRRMYEDPPVDSALYILNQAALKPQKLHYALEILVERTYISDDAQAAEALFLLYEMMFERESHKNVRGRTTRQLAFTLAASHCDTSNLTKHMETSPKDLVSSLINRLGVANYPFLVAVAVHLPHAVAHLPRVARFVSMFEAHAVWQESVRNENVTDFENSVALDKLGKLDNRVKKLTKAWKKIENNTVGDDDAAPSVENTKNNNNNNNNNSNGNDDAPQQQQKQQQQTNKPNNKTRALILDDSDASKNNNNNNNNDKKSSGDIHDDNDNDGNEELTTHQRQKMVENIGKSAEENLRLRALFSGISREAVDAIFHKWYELSDLDKANRINAFKDEWKKQRESWPSAQSDMIDIIYELRLLFGDDALHKARQNDLIPFFNNIYEGDAVEGLRQEYSRKIMNQGWNERRRKEFNKYVGKYYDQENIREEVLRENMMASGPLASSDGASGNNTVNGTGNLNASATLDGTTGSSLIGSAIAGIGKKVMSTFTKLGVSQRGVHARRNRAPEGIHYLQLDEYLKEASGEDRAPTHFIPLRIFEVIWKKIVEADVSTEFKDQLQELSEMVFGTGGIPALRKKKLSDNNNNTSHEPAEQQQTQNVTSSNAPDNNTTNNNITSSNDTDKKDEPNVIINADAFYINCVVSPDAHNLTSVPSNHYKIQHDFLYNSVQLLLYFPFIALFTALLLLNQNNLATYSSVSVKDFVTRPFKSPDMRPFEQISNSDHWRNWVEQNVFGFLPETEGQPYLGFSGNTFVVGGIRIRQLRVESVENCGYPDPGALPSEMSGSFYSKRKQVHFPSFCEPRWSVGFEQKSDILTSAAAAGLSAAARAAFTYSDETFCAGQQEGFSGYYSSCHGYTAFFPASQSRANASKLLDEIMPLWIDASTRALSVDFFIYNFNDDIYVRHLILGETSAGGGWKFRLKQDPFRLFTFSPIGASSVTWIVVMVFFIVAYIVTFFVFIAGTVNSVRRFRRKLSCTISGAIFETITESSWWWCELVTYLSIGFSLCTRFYFMAAPSDVVRVYRDEFPSNLESYAEAAWALILLDAVNTFLIYARVFYFVRLNNDFNILPKTLSKAANYMLSVLLVSVVVLVGFSLAGYVVYGATVFSMSSVPKSLLTLTLSIFGHGDYDNWLYDKPIWTVVYYALFSFVCVQILFNMITSVLARAYSDAKSERFDPSVLRHARSADSTIIGSRKIMPQFWGILRKEFVYRCYTLWRFFERCCNDSWFDQTTFKVECHNDTLQNPYTFYRFMDETISMMEQGSPRRGGVAAGNMLITLDCLNREDYQSHEKLQRRWNIAVRASPSLIEKIFGVKRPTLMNYAAEQLPKGEFAFIYFFCVTLPGLFLGLAPAEAIEQLLDTHQGWAQSARKYKNLRQVDVTHHTHNKNDGGLDCDSESSDENGGDDENDEGGDEEEIDQQLGQAVGAISKSARRIIRNYKQ